jgi:hypothetical protein
MKQIEWHNPKGATPPEGFRLLVPEEVDGGHEGKALMWRSGVEGRWTEKCYAKSKTQVYAVPITTPMPEGYAVIDGEPWQLDGWAVNVPMVGAALLGIPAERMMEVRYRNGNTARGPRAVHYFGRIRGIGNMAEIIGFRFLDEETPVFTPRGEEKPMTATDVLERRCPTEQRHMRVEAMTETLRQQCFDIQCVLNENVTLKRDLLIAQQENQRLEQEMTDLKAIINDIRSLLP